MATRASERRDPQHYELPTDSQYGFTVVLAKIGNGPEVTGQSAHDSHEFDITLCLFLKLPIGLNAVHVTVNINLEKRALG
jgi:hypothetical protein